MESNSLADYQQQYNAMIRDRMDAITNPLQNAVGAGGAGGSILGYANQGSVLTGIQNSYGRTDSFHDPNRDIHLDVTRADNGYILRVTPRMGGTQRVLVASTIEELRDLITSEMVSQSMEK